MLAAVGFDYAEAIRRLARKMTYQEIARHLGYKNKTCVQRILEGSIPSHIRGEALWVLYRETFDEKPPHTSDQARGLSGTNLRSTPMRTKRSV